MRHRLTAALALSILGTACGGGSPVSPSAPPSSAPFDEIGLAVSTVDRAPANAADAAAAAGAVNAFGFDLYRLLADHEDGNLVVSPASIALALGMARAGAGGLTAEEMDAVLHRAASDEHAAWLNALERALADRNGSFPDSAGEPQDVTLRTANATFAQHDVAWNQAYLDALAGRFGAGLRLVDYVSDAEAARVLINGWVEEQTESRIPELLAPETIGEFTRLVLVNAIYLQAAWATPFDEAATSDGRFTLPDGTTVDTPMMRTTERFGYASGDGWQAIELPYVGDELGMTLIVPDDLAAFEPAVDEELLDAIITSLVDRHVELSLPRFGIETKTSLPELLSELGMPTAFTGFADFSPMTDELELFISDVVHQANIDVDEAGTEAAAATAVIVEWTSAPTTDVTLTVDRPFLFALRDTTTGAVLFLGRVTDPTSR